MANKEPIAWITRGGKHIPIYDNGPTDDEKKKNREIKENEKQANEKNTKHKNVFTSTDYAKSLKKWTNESRTTPQDKQILENFIEERFKDMGPVKYAYGLSRGISMSNAELDNLHEGDIWAEKKLVSWTGQIGQAQNFSRHNVSDKKPNKVVVRTKSEMQKAAKLSGLPFRFGNKFAEAEVLVSSKAKFKIDKIKRARHDWDYTEIWVTPI